MAGLPVARAFDDAEYAAIESTISASERGRWFLAEHGRRSRVEETRTVLSAIERLEQAVTSERPAALAGSLRGGLVEMAEAISRTKGEIAAIRDENADRTRLASASEALDAIVRSTEQATSEILSAAESVQEAAWTLRERHVEPDLCETLDRHATTIYTACSFQDLTAQRTARIIDTLRYLEERIAAMIEIWGREADRIPPPPDAAKASRAGADAEKTTALDQTDVDRYIAMGVPAVTAAALSARPGSPALHEDIVFVPVTETAADDRADDEADALEWSVDTAGEGGVTLEDMLSGEHPEELLPVEAVPETGDLETEALETEERETAAPVEGDTLDFILADPPTLTVAALDALSPEERLAAFA